MEWYDTTRNGACIRFARIPHLGILCPLAVIDSPGLPTAVSSLSHRAVITRGEDNLGMQPASAISQRFPIFSARLHPPSPCRLSPLPACLHPLAEGKYEEDVAPGIEREKGSKKEGNPPEKKRTRVLSYGYTVPQRTSLRIRLYCWFAVSAR